MEAGGGGAGCGVRGVGGEAGGEGAGWRAELLDVIVMDSQFCHPQDGKID